LPSDFAHPRFGCHAEQALGPMSRVKMEDIALIVLQQTLAVLIQRVEKIRRAKRLDQPRPDMQSLAHRLKSDLSGPSASPGLSTTEFTFASTQGAPFLVLIRGWRSVTF
jgi:hypothetical protein